MKKIIYFLFLTLPVITFAVTTPINFKGVIDLIIGLIQIIIPILLSLSVLAFVWGLAKFVLNSGDAKSHAEGKQFMQWSIIALFCMVTVWGIIAYARNEVGFTGGLGIPYLPE